MISCVIYVQAGNNCYPRRCFCFVVSPGPAKLQGSAAVGSSLPSWPPAVKIDPDYDKLKKFKRFMMYT